MKRVECEFEAEVLAAVAQSRWPGGVDPALREHAEACPICADVAAVAGAIERASEGMRSSIVVPPAGRVWWLAQMRARREAAKAAGRPITAVQVFAFAAAMGLLGACFGATSDWFQGALRRFAAGLAAIDLAAFGSLIAEHGALAIGMAALLLLTPAAVYLAIRRE